MSRFPGAWRADAIAYTQEDLATIEQVLQRPLSGAFTQQLQQWAYEFRLAQAQQSEVQCLAQERKRYVALLKHLQAIEKIFDTWDKRGQMDFVQCWNKAAPRSGSRSGDAYKIMERLSQFDQTGQSLKFMCDIVLKNLPRPTKSKPLAMFIRQLMFLYTDETGNEPTSSYDGMTQTGHTPFGITSKIWG